MALWKEQSSTTGGALPGSSRETSVRDLEKPVAVPLSSETRRGREQARASAEPKESVIAADLTIEGKIEGSGHVLELAVTGCRTGLAIERMLRDI